MFGVGWGGDRQFGNSSPLLTPAFHVNMVFSRDRTAEQPERRVVSLSAAEWAGESLEKRRSFIESVLFALLRPWNKPAAKRATLQRILVSLCFSGKEWFHSERKDLPLWTCSCLLVTAVSPGSRSQRPVLSNGVTASSLAPMSEKCCGLPWSSRVIHSTSLELFLSPHRVGALCCDLL